MNIVGILVGIAFFIIIGVFHPIVIKTEYYLGKRAWPVFLGAGILACVCSLLLFNLVASAILAAVGFTCFWSIKELFEQEERVLKGWFPMNPKRKEYYQEMANRQKSKAREKEEQSRMPGIEYEG